MDYADSLCQAEADNAGLAGNYRAWLSDSFQSPAVEFTQLTTPYILPDGAVIAESYVDLTDGIIDTPVSVSPNLSTPGNNLVWSATATDGTAISAPNGAQPFCNNWSSSNSLNETHIGDSTATSASWTIAPQTVRCDSISARPYCSAQ